MLRYGRNIYKYLKFALSKVDKKILNVKKKLLLFQLCVNSQSRELDSSLPIYRFSHVTFQRPADSVNCSAIACLYHRIRLH